MLRANDLLCGNWASPNNSAQAQSALETCYFPVAKMQTLLHIPNYSLHFAPSNLFLFPKIKFGQSHRSKYQVSGDIAHANQWSQKHSLSC